MLNSAFDEFGFLKNGYCIQVSKYDFDNDSVNELIVSIGNKETELGIGVYKYTGDENSGFSQIGYFVGQSRALIDNEGIITTFSSSNEIINNYKWNGTSFSNT